MKLNEGIERNQYEQLRADIRAIIKETLLNKGYDEDEIEEYLRIEIKDHPDEENLVKVEIRGEWDYEDSLDFMDDVNKALQAYDPDSYMEHETANDIIATIRKDTTEDIPDQDMVDRYADLIKGTKNKEELKDVYMQIKLDDEQGILGNKGTISAIYDLVLDKFNKLDESLTEPMLSEFKQKVNSFDNYRDLEEYIVQYPELHLRRRSKDHWEVWYDIDGEQDIVADVSDLYNLDESLNEDGSDKLYYPIADSNDDDNEFWDSEYRRLYGNE